MNKSPEELFKEWWGQKGGISSGIEKLAARSGFLAGFEKGKESV